MSVLIPTMIGKHHLKLDMPGEFSNKVLQKCLTTTLRYYHVFHQILTSYGIPAMFYTDRRTIFEYKQSRSTKVENDSFTQFSYACKQLGVDIKTTSIPQAKGRVERAFQTLQQRLPIALRLAGITELSEANVFLNSYIKKYNAKFALPINNTKSVFEKQPDIGKRKIIRRIVLP